MRRSAGVRHCAGPWPVSKKRNNVDSSLSFGMDWLPQVGRLFERSRPGMVVTEPSPWREPGNGLTAMNKWLDAARRRAVFRGRQVGALGNKLAGVRGLPQVA